jgi:hypothetical protein
MQGMRKNALENYAWNVRVGHLTYILNSAFYRACYKRLFEKKKKFKKVKAELRSEGEDDIIENMEPCCSSSLQN